MADRTGVLQKCRKHGVPAKFFLFTGVQGVPYGTSLYSIHLLEAPDLGGCTGSMGLEQPSWGEHRGTIPFHRAFKSISSYS